MNRCTHCASSVDFYGISVQKRGFSENGEPLVAWSRWTHCPSCAMFASYDENGALRGSQKQEPPKTLFMSTGEGRRG